MATLGILARGTVTQIDATERHGSRGGKINDASNFEARQPHVETFSMKSVLDQLLIFQRNFEFIQNKINSKELEFEMSN